MASPKLGTPSAKLNASGAKAIFTRSELLDKAINEQRRLFDNAALDMGKTLSCIGNLEVERAELSAQLDKYAPDDFLTPQEPGTKAATPSSIVMEAPRTSPFPIASVAPFHDPLAGLGAPSRRPWHRESVMPKRTYSSTMEAAGSAKSHYEDPEF